MQGVAGAIGFVANLEQQTQQGRLPAATGLETSLNLNLEPSTLNCTASTHLPQRLPRAPPHRHGRCAGFLVEQFHGRTPPGSVGFTSRCGAGLLVQCAAARARAPPVSCRYGTCVVVRLQVQGTSPRHRMAYISEGIWALIPKNGSCASGHAIDSSKASQEGAEGFFNRWSDFVQVECTGLLPARLQGRGSARQPAAAVPPPSCCRP